MKILGVASSLALFLLSLPSSAQTLGPSASGSYRFLLDDDQVKLVEFDASTDEKGVTTGQMTFIDEADILDGDDAEDPRSGDTPPDLYLKASLHSLKVERNVAVMSGTVRESSHKSYIGRAVELVVQDSGDNLRIPDRLTWRLCWSQTRGWVPSDAERKDDDGAYLRWWATDAERKDDVGIPSVDLLGGEVSNCPAPQPLPYEFLQVQKWDGDIIVRP